ncbi:NADP-reducing hydrogenase subunit HndA [Halanaerobium congolense]|jgi:NADH-quinone oxidoreductase subunit E/NADP-reducing hydrogenase subunit HndA|uniref:NADP-reducing hydrogenase subunit HndA n=1 Tax=Halanaerobium congolense TaxID=54121 RepID=A0A1M7IUK3_9FIRM|nr:NADH-quinone oxidoreductase subunit NuoE [Halanaerobium congolense]KXS49656.1 MAG: NADH-ubiquinone oxidoreductase chain E [Halanaerobium sp. T82-1]PUU92849.1 MAG: NADH-ubiquinone oxidoreductase chain E [Halanaerobium sp.]PTX15505.1 NADP-reducing hydrogenase subunit HndA [Halanaerobium congolense]TDP21636.1 NADP-reducing hydrogenase subunit HndA [Halanaerobium congolense]TDX38398.1 NADP-reducing hydrogenase subunit HndA [Halanaerobium congolense]
MAEMTKEKLDEYLKPLTEILSRYEKKERYLIPVLQEAQEEYGYLPEEVMKEIALGLNLSLSQVYGVVTFYSQFHQEPRGNNIIRVCMGTACHVRGGDGILDAIKDELAIEAGETTEDLEFTLESVACIGACGLAPVIMINDDTHGRLTPDKIPAILAKYQ